MTPPPPSLRELFLAALDRPTPAERETFLADACGADDALRRRVDALLAAHDGPDPVLDRTAVEYLSDGPPADADALALSVLTPCGEPGSLGRLGHYRVTGVIGRGGFGVVFRAFDEKLHRVVAVKVLAPALATSGPARHWFVREARAAAAVSHDHVVPIYAVEDAAPVPYLVMQLVEGKTLQDKLAQTGPVALTELLRIGLQVAEGLSAAHRQGLVHRDVKPANILLENGVERVKLTDFGLARAADDSSQSQSGLVAGTPMYMSPEQAHGERVDARSDLFSLGSVLYAMAAGHPPFRAGSPLAVLKRVAEDTPRPLAEVNPTVPGWLADLIGRLMEKKPADRFASAAEVAALLGRHLAHLQGRAAAPPAPPDSPRRPRPTRWVAAAAVVALGAAAAAVVLRPHPAASIRPPEERPPVVAAAWPPALRPLPGPAELAARPAAADALDPANVPPDVLALTALGAPPAPVDRLVAALGDAPALPPDDPVPCQALAVAVSPDGRLAATTGRSDRTVRVWDLATGLPRHLLTGYPSRGYTLAFSGDSKTLASGDIKGTAIKLWDVESGGERATLTPTGPLYQIALSPDGGLLATAGPGQPVVVWELPGGRIRHPLRVGASYATAVAFNQDGTLLAGGGEDGVVRVWDAATGAERATLAGNGPEVRWLGFHPNGRGLAVASARKGVVAPVQVWDLTTEAVRHRLDAPDGGVLAGAWRADGRVLFLGGAVDGNVRAWDLTGDTPRSSDLPVVPSGVEWLHGLALTPEGRHLLVTHPRGPALVLRLAPRGTVFALPAPRPN